MKVYRDIFENYGKMLEARSRDEHKKIAVSSKKDGARPLVVGLYQMRNSCSGLEGKKKNLEHMLKAIRQMGSKKVQIMAFPEMCLPGYFTNVSGTPRDSKMAAHELADVIGESPFLAQLCQAARQNKMVIAFGFSEKYGKKFYNSIGVIDADGKWLGRRWKNPLFPWDYETKSFTQPAKSLRSAVFKTRYATIGISNCFDGEFPESVRQMRLDGAELLLWCNASCGNSKLGWSGRIHLSGGHAQANFFWVVCCNCVSENTTGTSCILSPNGEPLVVLPPNEEALGIGRIDLAMSAKWDGVAMRANWDLWRTRLCRNVRRQ